MQQKVLLSVGILIAICWSGCGPGDDDDDCMKAEFAVVSQTIGVTGDGSAYVEFTVENIGVRQAYNVSCRISVRNGDTVVSTAMVRFANVDIKDQIEPGEQEQLEVIFPELDSLDGFTLDYEFVDWYEPCG
jgi:uncharacterized protein (TIGR02588 family)